MHALVLGGCGFIGSHLVDQLISEGHSVRVFDRQPEHYREAVSGVEYVFGDFTDIEVLDDVLVGIDTVFHLISTTLPGTANLDPQRDVRENLIGTLNLLDRLVDHQIKRILYLSSGGTVYGIPTTIPVPEDHAFRPINSYGIVKATIEHYLKMYCKEKNLSPVIIRASNPYGPRQGHSGLQGVVSTFLGNIKESKQIEIWGDGSVVRDYIYIDDLAKLCVLAAKSKKIGAFNAGSGVGCSLNEIIDEIMKVTGIPIKPIYKPGRALDVPCSVLDITHAQQLLGWRCDTTLNDGLQKTWRWISGAN